MAKKIISSFLGQILKAIFRVIFNVLFKKIGKGLWNLGRAILQKLGFAEKKTTAEIVEEEMRKSSPPIAKPEVSSPIANQKQPAIAAPTGEKQSDTPPPAQIAAGERSHAAPITDEKRSHAAPIADESDLKYPEDGF